jgi:hypothetical protein
LGLIQTETKVSNDELWRNIQGQPRLEQQEKAFFLNRRLFILENTGKEERIQNIVCFSE